MSQIQKFSSTSSSALTIQTDSGSATPSADVIQILGGTNITTSGAGNIVLIDSTGSTSPLTTKGDLYTYTSVDARLPVGTDGYVLSANSATATGLEWVTAPASGVSTVSGTANRITSTGGANPVIDISASYVGQSSITTLGTVTTGVWTGTDIALADGGTNASLTASNGGIFYSTATAGAILAGTATEGQILRSGATAAPTWSTATYPATAGTSGNVLTSDGTNWTSAAPTASGTSYSFNLATSTGDPADATTYYLVGGTILTFFTSSVNRSRMYIPKTGTITAALGSCAVTGTLGSAGSSTVSIRLNNTTNTTVTSSLAMTSAFNTFSNTALSIAVTTGDFIEFIVATPTWATNPTTVTITMTCYIEVANAGGGSEFVWQAVTSADNPVDLVAGNAYIAKGASAVNFVLPATASVGDSFEILGHGNLWTLEQNASQSVTIGTSTTTVGVGGSITATAITDRLTLVCATTNTEFYENGMSGTLTIV